MKLKQPKACLCCGVTHMHLTANHRFSDDVQFGGYYWECACKTTFFTKESGVVLVLDSGHEADSQMENLVCMAESLEER